jgi:hypothetical protein
MAGWAAACSRERDDLVDLGLAVALEALLRLARAGDERRNRA